jgi:hypothetical protein
MINEFFATDVWKYLLGAILGTCLPSPVDPIHFYIQNWLYKHKLKRWQFEAVELFDWYLLDAMWYCLLTVLAIVLAIDDTTQINKIIIMLTVLGVGVLISIVWRFLSKSRRKMIYKHHPNL